MPLAVIGCWRVTTRPPTRTVPGVAIVEGRVRHRAQPVERRPEQPDDLPPGIEPDDRVGVADPLRLGQAGRVGAVGRRQAQVHRPDAGPRERAALRRAAVDPAARRAGDLAQLPQQLAPRPTQRIQRPDPDQPLEHLLGQPGPLDDVRQARVRPARQLRVEQRLVLLADPLDQPQPEPDAPADGAVGRPPPARRVGRDHAAADGPGRVAARCRVLGEWLVRVPSSRLADRPTPAGPPTRSSSCTSDRLMSTGRTATPWRFASLTSTSTG